jgi:hypothetical protein
MKRHVRDMHTAGDFPCARTFCDLILTTRHNKEQHVKTCFLRCLLENCDRKFEREDKLEAHKRMHLIKYQRFIYTQYLSDTSSHR